MDRPVVLATLCYVKRKDHTLMLHRIANVDDIHEGKWNGLGGKFEPGETPEECVIREVQEESGLRLNKPLMRGILTFPQFDGDRDWYVFVFTCRDFEGQAWTNSPEGRLEWVPDDLLLDLNLWEGDEVFLRWLEHPRFFSGKFVYADEELKQHQVSFYPAGDVPLESF